MPRYPFTLSSSKYCGMRWGCCGSDLVVNYKSGKFVMEMLSQWGWNARSVCIKKFCNVSWTLLVTRTFVFAQTIRIVIQRGNAAALWDTSHEWRLDTDMEDNFDVLTKFVNIISINNIYEYCCWHSFLTRSWNKLGTILYIFPVQK